LVDDLDQLEKGIKNCSVESGCLSADQSQEPAKWQIQCKQKNACFERLKKAYGAQKCKEGWGGQSNTYTCSK
jgi:hypothetical protein